MDTEKIRKELKANREEILELRKQCAHYRNAYFKQKKEADCCKDELKIQCELNRDLEQRILVLDRQVIEHQLISQPKTTHKLAWNEITHAKTKRRRVKHYKEEVLKSIQNTIPDCERIQVSVSVGGKTLKFEWYHNDLNSQDTSSEIGSSQESSDHNYSSNAGGRSSDSDTPESFDLSDIYDSSGKFLPKHKQGIVHVMDNFRISKLAYHELYMQSQGHLPPVGQIFAERKKMSESIPYHKHSTVSLQVLNLQLHLLYVMCAISFYAYIFMKISLCNFAG